MTNHPNRSPRVVERFTLASDVDRAYVRLCIARGDHVSIDAGRVTVTRNPAHLGEPERDAEPEYSYRDELEDDAKRHERQYGDAP